MIYNGYNQTNEQLPLSPSYFLEANDLPEINDDFLDQTEETQLDTNNHWINQNDNLFLEQEIDFMNCGQQYNNDQQYQENNVQYVQNQNMGYQQYNYTEFQEKFEQDNNSCQCQQSQQSESYVQSHSNNENDDSSSENVCDKKSLFKAFKQQIDEQIQKLLKKYSLMDSSIDFKYIHLQKDNDLRENLQQELIQIFDIDIEQLNPTANKKADKYKNQTFWCKCGCKYANYHGIKYHIQHQHQVKNGIQVPTWVWQVKIRDSFGRPKSLSEGSQ